MRERESIISTLSSPQMCKQFSIACLCESDVGPKRNLIFYSNGDMMAHVIVTSSVPIYSAQNVGPIDLKLYLINGFERMFGQNLMICDGMVHLDEYGWNLDRLMLIECVVDCKWNGMKRMEYNIEFLWFKYPEFIFVYESEYYIIFFKLLNAINEYYVCPRYIFESVSRRLSRNWCMELTPVY